MSSAAAHAKINLGLAVGARGPDGYHEVATLLQRLELADTVSVEAASGIEVTGFPDDTLVGAALTALAEAAGGRAGFRARIEKRIPVAAGLGGGSSDAASALLLGNALLEEPLPPARLAALAARLGSDVPFFLEPGPQLATGTGTTLAPAPLPQDYAVLLLLPHGQEKASTASVYAGYAGAAGFEQRRAALLAAAAAGPAADLGALPGNDLAASEHSARLRACGAFRAEVSGAGPTLYGLFAQRAAAEAAAAELADLGEIWLTGPAW